MADLQRHVERAHEEVQLFRGEPTPAMIERVARAIQEAESSADATAWYTGAWAYTAARAALAAAFPRKDDDHGS